MKKRLETSIEPSPEVLTPQPQQTEWVIEMTPERRRFWKRVIVPMARAYADSQRHPYNIMERPIGSYAT